MFLKFHHGMQDFFFTQLIPNQEKNNILDYSLMNILWTSEVNVFFLLKRTKFIYLSDY